MTTHTYLDMVNKVLVNLRENQVTAVNSTAYSTLIGEFVNQAKEAVEDSWRWRNLSTELAFVTQGSNQVLYPLTSSASSPPVSSTTTRYPDDRSYMLKDDRDNFMCFDTTLVSSLVLYQMSYVPRERATGDIYLAPGRTPSNPYLFTYSWEADVMNFYMVNPPTVGRTITSRWIIPQSEFIPGTDENTIVLVPWRPIVSFATANAMRERGEELGQSADLYETRGNAELARAQENDRAYGYDQLLVDDGNNNTWSLN